MKMKTTGLWASLETLAVPMTVLAEWRMVLAGEFADAEPFLRVTQEQAEGYPCTNQPACECRHEVVFHSPENIKAGCRCEPSECNSIRLEPKDLLIYAIETRKLCGAIARAFRFEPATTPGGTLDGAPNIWPVGTYTRTRSQVFLCLCQTDDIFLTRIERLIHMQAEPFILLVPSQRSKSAAVQSLLQRQWCEFIPLASSLVLAGKGKFQETQSIQPILDRFAAGLAKGHGLVKTVERIGRDLSAVANQNQELRTDNARLKQMQSEGLFAFAKKIDPETLAQFFTILTFGDVAKACRELGLSDSTLRSKIAGWRDRGKAYSVLWEIVRWRKSIHGQAGMEFAKRVASGVERDVDYPALIRDVLGELESFNSDNWAEKCDGLETLLRSGVS